MEELKDIKDLWQQDSVDVNRLKFDRIKSGIDYINLQYRVRKWIISIVTVISIFMLSKLGGYYNTFSFWSGILFISSGLIMITIMFWKYPTIPKTIKESDSNVECIRSNINILKSYIKIPSIYLPIYCLLLLVGLNFINYNLFNNYNTEKRLIIHFGFTVSLAIFLILAVKIKTKLVKQKIEPIINNLTNLLTTLNS